MTFPAVPTTSAEDTATLLTWDAAFIFAFPEFAGTPQAIRITHLRTALLRTPSDVWGDLLASGVYALAAHLIAMSPGGEAMRLAGETTIYQKERNRLNRIVASGFRIAGLP